MKVNIGKYPKLGDKRKVSIRIDSHDLWNLDTTLSIIILAALKAYRENVPGHPASMTLKKWETILDDMILAFAMIAEDDHPKDEDGNIHHGLRLFVKYFQCLWI